MKRLSMFVLALAMALGLYSLGAPKDAAAAASAADQRLKKLEARVAALEQANAALRGMVRVDKRVLSLEADRINISGTDISVKSRGPLKLEASGNATLRGSRVNVN